MIACRKDATNKIELNRQKCQPISLMSISSNQRDLIQLCILAAPSFNLAATTAFVDPFRVANYLFGRRYAWAFQSVGGGLLQASNTAELKTSGFDPAAPGPDFLVLSTSWSPEALARPKLLATIRRWARAGTRLVTIDTGAFVLGAAGLLTRGQVTVHPEHRQSLAELYPTIEVLDQRWVDDPLVLSCASGSGAFDCALAIIATDLGAIAREQVRDYLLGPAGDGIASKPALAASLSPGADEGKARSALRPSVNQASGQGGSDSDALVARAQHLMLAHLEELISIPDLARRLGIHQRALERAFKAAGMGAPLGRYLDLRLGRAQELLTQTSLPMFEVALACGFSSSGHFSRVFKRHFGLTPTGHRQRGKVAFELRFLSEKTG